MVILILDTHEISNKIIKMQLLVLISHLLKVLKLYMRLYWEITLSKVRIYFAANEIVKNISNYIIFISLIGGNSVLSVSSFLNFNFQLIIISLFNYGLIIDIQLPTLIRYCSNLLKRILPLDILIIKKIRCGHRWILILLRSLSVISGGVWGRNGSSVGKWGWKSFLIRFFLGFFSFLLFAM